MMKTKKDLKAHVMSEIKKSPLAKNLVVIGFLVDGADENDNPISGWQKVAYHAGMVVHPEFYKTLQSFTPGRPLAFEADKNGHVSWAELQKQFESEYNKGKIELFWDGPAEAAKAAKTTKPAPDAAESTETETK